jgi:hypothetical protein
MAHYDYFCGEVSFGAVPEEAAAAEMSSSNWTSNGDSSGQRVSTSHTVRSGIRLRDRRLLPLCVGSLGR